MATGTIDKEQERREREYRERFERSRRQRLAADLQADQQEQALETELAAEEDEAALTHKEEQEREERLNKERNIKRQAARRVESAEARTVQAGERAAARLARQAAKEGAKAAAKQGARAGAAAAAEGAGVGIAAALAYVGGIILAVLAVLFVIFIIVFVFLVYACNYSDNATIIQFASAAYGWFGGTDVCKALKFTEGGSPTGTGQGTNFCTTQQLQALATQYGTPYPNPKNAPQLDALIGCIGSIAPVSSTFDRSNNACNYTRGRPVCTADCNHAVDSCHYGGASGTEGALAVDYAATGALGDQVISRARQCASSLGIGLKRVTCEDGNAAAVACTSGASHVHISLAICDRDAPTP